MCFAWIDSSFHFDVPARAADFSVHENYYAGGESESAAAATARYDDGQPRHSNPPLFNSPCICLCSKHTEKHQDLLEKLSLNDQELKKLGQRIDLVKDFGKSFIQTANKQVWILL